MGHTSAQQADTEPPRLIARELAVGFGVVTLVAVAMCGFLLILINQVSGLVMGMRHGESAIRQGLELATTVREQYIHIAHSVIEGDRSHLARYEEQRERVRAGIERLTPHVPADERWRIAALEEKIGEMDARFTTFALPAIDRGDRAQVLTLHRAIAVLAAEASAQADALARAVESRMAHSHVLATRATRLGLVGGGVLVLLVMALSIGFTLRLRAAVLRPLTVLTGAARRFGAGDFTARVGAVGRGELRALARAFDRMAEELAERQRRLVHNERMAAIGQLAAGVAHELNNPIGIIRGYLKTMAPEGDPATLKEELQILDEEAAHCQRIAEDLLSYARPVELHLVLVPMKAFLEETIRRFRESPGARGADIKVDAQQCEVPVDPARLRQVVLNLVLNAVQASPAAASVAIVGRADERHYVIELADRGPGIPEDERGRVFEPFYSRRQGGSGLGLAVCQGILAAHGGDVTIHSRDGGGALLQVRLPLAAIDRAVA